jgi:hypothetical protein
MNLSLFDDHGNHALSIRELQHARHCVLVFENIVIFERNTVSAIVLTGL